MPGLQVEGALIKKEPLESNEQDTVLIVLRDDVIAHDHNLAERIADPLEGVRLLLVFPGLSTPRRLARSSA